MTKDDHCPIFTGPIPETWMDTVKLSIVIRFTTTVGRCIALHGNLVLASKHPQNTGWPRKIAEEMLDTLEAIFRDVGLEEPAQGWRGEAP